MKWSDLAERQILKAQAEGQLDNLKGAGKPLNADGAETTDAIGFRIMAEAGALPKEVQLRKALEDARARLATANEADRRAIMTRINDLQLRLDIEAEARRKYLR